MRKGSVQLAWLKAILCQGFFLLATSNVEESKHFRAMYTDPCFM